MTRPRRIFIVGNSGAGKGVLAEGVAAKLGWKFVSADFSLAPSIGRPLHEVLGTQGEAAFYKSLLEILSYQCSSENIVVTTDDSIVCDEQCRKLLSSEFTVHLQVTTPVQLQRISYNRPLLPNADFRGFLDKLHKERDKLYDEVASYTLSSDDNALEQHVANVIKEFEK